MILILCSIWKMDQELSPTQSIGSFGDLTIFSVISLAFLDHNILLDQDVIEIVDLNYPQSYHSV